MSLVDVERLRELAELEFADIVVEGFIPDINEVRLILIDGLYECTRVRKYVRNQECGIRIAE